VTALPAVTAPAAPSAAPPAAASVPDVALLPLFSLLLPDTADMVTPVADAVDAAATGADGEGDVAAPAGLVDWLLSMAPPVATPPPVAANDAPVALPSMPAEVAEPAVALPAAVKDLPDTPAAPLPAPPDATAPPAFTLSAPLPAPTAAAPGTPAAAAPLPPAPVLPPLSLEDPDWSASLGERVSWATESGLSEATIDLHPEELGPIRIRIETQGSLADVSFQAANAATRDLLAQSLPQLRGLLNGQGMDMGRSQVAALPAPRRGEGRGVSEEPVSGAGRRLYRVGLVDDYA